MRTICVALTLSATVTVLVSGCGNDSGTGQADGSTEAVTTPANSFPKTIDGQLAQTFPKPEVEAGSPPGTAAAIDAGRRACKGKTPIEVRDEFIAAAEAEVVLNEGQKKMLAEIAKFEKQASHSPDFAAGQLAAGVYEATLPEEQKAAGYRGCVYELALQLRREIAKTKG
jgi:hypothetical protein